jgi:hypothetical protein
MPIQITEYADATAATMQRETNTIRGVKIIGTQSKNGRTYPAAVLREAIELYEGGRVYVSHPHDTKKPRDYRDRIGKIHHVHLQSDGLYGNLTYNPKHPLAEQLAWDAEHAPDSVGLSHSATVTLGRTVNKRQIVESIDVVHSIDLVAEPATTRGLYEQEENARSQAEAAEEEDADESAARQSGQTEEIHERLGRIEEALQALTSRRPNAQRPQSRDQQEAARPLRSAKEWAQEIMH